MQYVCAVLVLCQCAPVSTHTGLLHNQSGDTHAVAEVTCANKVFNTALISHWVYWSNDLSTLLLSSILMLIFTRPYQAIQLIAVSSEGGAIPCFQLWTHRALIRFPLHFCTVCKRCTLNVVNTIINPVTIVHLSEVVGNR